MPNNALTYTFLLLFFGSCLRAQDSLRLTIYFDTDQYQITDRHKSTLSSFMQDHFTEDDIASVYVQGYADRRGSAAYNTQLSQRRVNSTSEYLLTQSSKKVKKVRSQALGSDLAGDNLRQDRRVDITFYKNLTGGVAYNKAIEIDDIERIDESLLKKGTHLKIKNLNFQPGRSKLLQSSIPQLKAVEKLLQKHLNVSIRIEGHVCCSSQLQDDNDGRDIDNNERNLSEARAKNIHDYLIKKGINPDRLSYKGYGHSRMLVDPELTEEDRMKNRRVEFLITSS